MKFITKKLLTFMLVATLLTGCSEPQSTTTNNSTNTNSSSQQTTPQAEPTPDSNTESSQEFDEFPRTMENYDGSIITIESKPETVASMVFGTDEMLLDLIDLDKVVGLSGKDNGILFKSDPENLSKDILRISDNAEILVDLYPEAVIGAGWVSSELQDIMKDMDIPFYGYKTPKTLIEHITIIQEIGYFLGEDEKANAIVEDMTNRMNAVTDKSSTITDKVNVMAYNMHGSTSAKGTLFDDLLSLAGGINLSAEAGLEGTAAISKEQLVDMNPEVIILVKWAKDTTEEFDSFLEEMMNDESLSTISAIENERVYISLDNSISNVSHFVVSGLEFIAESCYPELY